MSALPRNADGVIELDCVDLCPQLVWHGLVHAMRNEIDFLGRPPEFWREIVLSHAQKLADEADPEQYEWWEIKYLEASK